MNEKILAREILQVVKKKYIRSKDLKFRKENVIKAIKFIKNKRLI